MYTPVTIFTYNRPGHLSNTINSLKNCAGIKNTEVFIFCDGPRSEADKQKQQQIANDVATFAGENFCKNMTFFQHETNNGIYKSVTQGVATILEKFGRVIVLEDDLIVSPFFLTYMNEALEAYKNSANVYAVNGYMIPVRTDKKSCVLLPYISSWGWATWSEKWNDFAAAEPEKDWKSPSIHLKRRFNLAYYDYDAIFKEPKRHWDIDWYFHVFSRNGLCVFPSFSLVSNMGFDGSGENCGPNLWNTEAGYINEPINVVLQNKIDIEFYNHFLEYYGSKLLLFKSVLRKIGITSIVKKLVKKNR